MSNTGLENDVICSLSVRKCSTMITGSYCSSVRVFPLQVSNNNNNNNNNNNTWGTRLRSG
jgi:hypothetical protein